MVAASALPSGVASFSSRTAPLRSCPWHNFRSLEQQIESEAAIPANTAVPAATFENPCVLGFFEEELGSVEAVCRRALALSAASNSSITGRRHHLSLSNLK